jgi:hypothetical protein
VLIALAAVLAPVAASYGIPQNRPEQLNGEVTGVSGERARISLTDENWLPRAGCAVEIGAEMAGLWVPLKGNFVVVQVNENSVEAQHVGGGEHREPARGMKAIIATPAYIKPPQSRAEYVGDREQEAMILSMAEGGSRQAQHVAALAFEGRGDHDAALQWWERASAGADERFFISYSATGRARILTTRGEYREAVRILSDAAARMQPRPDELIFSAYSERTGADMMAAVDLYVDVLEGLGNVYRTHMEAPDEAARWFREAAEVMGAAATNGVPGAGEPAHDAYMALLNELGDFLLYALKDEEEAVKYLQIAARAGNEPAQRTLTRLGYPWQSPLSGSAATPAAPTGRSGRAARRA